MAKGLDNIINESITTHPKRRRSDDASSLPGYHSLQFIEDYIGKNPDVPCLVVSTEHLKGVQELIGAMQAKFEEEHHNARHDALTEISNRFGLEEQLGEMVREADQNNSNITYIFFDIDNFKGINTQYTHEGGDEILKALGSAIRKVTRPQDYSGRVGGEEFVLVLKDTNMDEGLKAAARIKNTIEKTMDSYRDSKKIPATITLSMGVSNYTGNSSNVHDMTQKAKEALQHAKEMDGKGRIVYHAPQGALTEYLP